MPEVTFLLNVVAMARRPPHPLESEEECSTRKCKFCKTEVESSVARRMHSTLPKAVWQLRVRTASIPGRR